MEWSICARRCETCERNDSKRPWPEWANCIEQNQNSKPGNMKETKMLQGLRTVIYRVDNLDKAKAWYAEVLGVTPYFDEPFYVGFNVGGFELGLDPDMKGVTKGSNVVAYWGVKDIDASYKRLLELGAQPHSEVQEVCNGIRVAAVTDPFGDVVGIIENPNFKIDDAV